MNLLKTTDSRVLRYLALKVIKWEVASIDGARTVVKHGLIPVLTELSQQIMKHPGNRKLKLKRDLTGIVATLTKYGMWFW